MKSWLAGRVVMVHDDICGHATLGPLRFALEQQGHGVSGAWAPEFMTRLTVFAASTASPLAGPAW